MSTPLQSLTLLLVVGGGMVVFFCESRICKDDQYDAYQRLGEVLANDTAPNSVTPEQLKNATEFVTSNSTLEPLCFRQMLFVYEYRLKEMNVPRYGLLSAELEALANRGSICDCKIPGTAVRAVDAIGKLGKNPTKSAIQSVLNTYGYTDHQELYANCRTMYVPLIPSYLRVTEELLGEMRLEFEREGEILLDPILSKPPTVSTSADPLDELNTGMKLLKHLLAFQPMTSVFGEFVAEAGGNPFSLSHECASYRSTAAALAAKGEAIERASLQEMRDTLELETGDPRVRSACLNYFLEEYWRNGLKLNSSTPYYTYQMVENVFRGHRLSTVTDLDRCNCPIPTTTRKLVADLVGLGPSPNLSIWNEVLEKYGYVEWALSYEKCPVLEWYLEGIKKKFGPATTEKRFKEIGFNLTLTQTYLGNKYYWN